MIYHKPVMLAETLAHLKTKEGGKYIDMTLGDGGHTIELLKIGAQVLGVDINENSLKRAEERIKSLGLMRGFIGYKGNFRDVNKFSAELQFNNVNGILFDLGYSSYQLESGGLGLSFQSTEPLDMRLSSDLGVTAADIVNSFSEKELEKVIREYSDERYSKRIARTIINHRNLKKIQTAKELADILLSGTPPDYERGRIHPATRTFQALRILVNDEIGNLELSLPRAAQLLVSGGRMIVITFHSLEDKVVKQFGQGAQPHIKTVNKKPLEPSEQEVALNMRARSAKMRIFEKI